ncbi:MAG: methylmalonyl-CoA carboxyltransferase [Desulfobacterales bacterium]|nr:methylmalonyl-CoA carboxyltransferase [Desulfobacterales bacterium]
MKKKVEELKKKKAKLEMGGGLEKIGKQHSMGKYTARERIEKLLDKDTFREIDLFVKHRCSNFGMEKVKAPADAVITGFGKINGRTVYIFSQDFTVLGGSLGEAQASKIVKIMDLAAKEGAPIIGLNDSGGGRIQEGVDAQYGYTRIFYRNSIYSGVIPQISAILGPCAGGACYSPAITDFIFMNEGISQMFLTGPKIIKQVTGESLTAEELGGARVHCETSGVSHFCTNSEDECFEKIRRLLGFIPSNFRDSLPINYGGDPVNRTNDKLLSIVPTDISKSYDIGEVIAEITDDHDFLEVSKNWAKNIVVGFARFSGIPVGIVANQPRVLAGVIDIDASDKAARFIRFCDSFGLPLITLVDTPAFFPSKKQEFGGIIRHGAKILFSYSEATVPKITLILRKGYGGGYIAMCHRELGADYVFAWPTAEIAIMGAEGAAEIIFHSEIQKSKNPTAERALKINEYRQQFSNPYVSASRGYVDDVIDPAQTRETIIQALDSIKNKRERLPERKHGNIPL